MSPKSLVRFTLSFCSTMLFGLALGVTSAVVITPSAAAAAMVGPEDEPGNDDAPTEVEPQADIEIAFCFHRATRDGATENVYAKNRAAAKAKAHPEQMWCHDGPCSNTYAPPEQCQDE